MEHHYYASQQNVMLRPLLKTDIRYLRKWRNAKKNTKYLSEIGYITRKKQKQWFEGYLKNPDEITFAILDCTNHKRMVGSVSLYDFQNDTAEFGKFLIGYRKAHGKKIGYHAAQAVLGIAFHTLGLSNVVLHCFQGNYSALKIYREIGFEPVTEKVFPDGKHEYEMEISKEKFLRHNHIKYQ